MTSIQNQQAFIALVKAGLWEQEVRLSSFNRIDFNEIFQLAEEQSVTGLVAAGLEHVIDVKVPKDIILQFVGSALQLEQRNMAMNQFVADIVEKMRDAGIYTLLLKGQAVAQCYERPLWRAAGDVDFFLSDDNYQKAKGFLIPIATNVEDEDCNYRHIAMTIAPWVVELHGSLRNGLWKRFDATLDEIQDEIIYGGCVRSWLNDKTQIFLPRVDEDIVYVFSHILQHFFQEGIGLRQVCDWCRLLWTYRGKIDCTLLQKRLCSMGVLTEWQTFAYLAVNKLGMPEEGMPFYTSSNRWRKNSNKVLDFIFETGNFGHNRDYGYYEKYPFLEYKAISLWRHTKDGLHYFSMFPIDSIKVWCSMIKTGITKTLKGI